MLQRSCLAQKQHLERTSSICKSFAYRLALHSELRLFSAKPSPKTLSTTIKAFRWVANPVRPIKNNTDNPLPSIPLKLSSVLRAVAGGTPQNEIVQSIEQTAETLSLFDSRDQMGATVVSLAKSATPDHALEILKLSNCLGRDLPSSLYETICLHFDATKQWKLLLNLIKVYEDHHDDISVSFLNWRAKAWLHTGQYSHLKGVLKDFEARCLSPTEQTFLILLKGFLRNRDSKGAKQCIKDLQQAGFPTTFTHPLVLHYHRQFDSNSNTRYKALERFHLLKPCARLKLVNNLIQAALEAGDLFGARDILSLFDRSSVADLAIFIAPQVNTQTDLSTTPLPKSLALHQLVPNGDTFVKFMNHQIRNSDPQGALRLWKMASSKGIKATEGAIVSIIHALFLTDRGDDAIKIISSSTEVVKSHKLARLMNKPNTFPSFRFPSTTLTIRISNAMLRGLLRRDGLTCVPTLFNVMYANNVSANEQTLDCILRHLKDTNATTPDDLIQLLGRVSSSVDPSPTYLHHLFGIILRSHRRRSFRGAWSTSGTSSNTRIDHPIRILDNFDPTAGLALRGAVPIYEGIQRRIQDLVDNGVNCDSPMMALRLLHDAVQCQDDESIISTLKVLLDRGLQVNEHHFGALVEGYASTGDFQLAFQAMAAAERFGVNPNVLMYTSIISAYAKKRDAVAASKLFEKMVETGIQPDVPAIDAVVSAYFARGDRSTARRMLISLWPLIEPFPDVLVDASLSKLLVRFRSLHNGRR